LTNFARKIFVGERLRQIKLVSRFIAAHYVYIAQKLPEKRWQNLY